MGISPFNLIVISALLWALQPVFILLIGAGSASVALSFLLLNTLTSAVVGALMAAFAADRAGLAKALRVPGALRDAVLFIGADAFFAAVSYTLLAWSAAEMSLSGAAVIFESWPIFVAIFAFIMVPKLNDRAWSAFLALAVFTIGYLLMSARDLTQMDGFDSGSLLALASAVSMGLAAISIQIVLKRVPAFERIRNFPLVTLGRGIGTAFVLLVISLVLSPEALVFDVEPRVIVAAIALGVLVALNEVTYHIGHARSSSNSVAMVALISPVLAPLILFALGEPIPHTEFFVGAGFILAGVALSQRDGDHSFQFIALIVGILAIGTMIVMRPGHSDRDFFNYVNTIAVFYALLQASAFSRLWQSVNQVDHRMRQLRRAYHARHNPGMRSVARDKVLSDLDWLRSVRLNNTTVSELVLLTVLALSNVAVVITTRREGVLSDSVSFLISVSSVFLIAYCWHMQSRLMVLASASYLHNPARLRERPISARLFSIFASVFLFSIFFVIILFGDRTGAGAGL
jgi:drug/metabolite transporter (DMT)-like permease